MSIHYASQLPKDRDHHALPCFGKGVFFIFTAMAGVLEWIISSIN
ncbi:hypothetical protein PAE9249_03893 [Paenibacillus sp. CECT 9249]|nr:hypothetical protein PAE9249_03893 [Paenibacillus sp. CECT 9249]